MYRFSKRSRDNLKGVHPDLVLVMSSALALTTVDFMITEGLRNKKRQKELFKQGASRTMNSRHLTGHAVCVAAIVDGKVKWDWPLYEEINVAVQKASALLKIPVEWGGNWPRFRDGPHYQLPWKEYPKDKKEFGMYTSLDKALVGAVMGVLFILTSFGVTVPDWANQTAVTTIVGVLNPLLVWLVPNRN